MDMVRSMWKIKDLEKSKLDMKESPKPNMDPIDF
jgi:hypothetical protein